MRNLDELISLHNALLEDADSTEFECDDILSAIKDGIDSIDTVMVALKILNLKISRGNPDSLPVHTCRRRFGEFIKANPALLKSICSMSLDGASEIAFALAALSSADLGGSPREELVVELFPKALIVRLLKANSNDHSVNILRLLSLVKIKYLLNSSPDMVEIFSSFGYVALSQVTDDKIRLKNGLIETIYISLLKHVKVKKIISFVFTPPIFEKLYKNGAAEVLEYLVGNFLDSALCKNAIKVMSPESDSRLIFMLLLHNDFYIQSFYQSCSNDSLHFAVLKIMQEMEQYIEESTGDFKLWSRFDLAKWLPKQYSRQYISRIILNREECSECMTALTATLSFLHGPFKGVTTPENYERQRASILSTLPSSQTIVSAFRYFHEDPNFDLLLLSFLEHFMKIIDGSVDFDAFKMFLPSLEKFSDTCQLIILRILNMVECRSFDTVKNLFSLHEKYSAQSDLSEHCSLTMALIRKLFMGHVLFEKKALATEIVSDYLVQNPANFAPFIEIIEKFSNAYELYKLDGLSPGNLLIKVLETSSQFNELSMAFSDALGGQNNSGANLSDAMDIDENLSESASKLMEQIMTRKDPSIYSQLLTCDRSTIQFDMKFLIFTMKRYLLNPDALEAIRLMLGNASEQQKVAMLKLLANHSKFLELIRSNLNGFLKLWKDMQNQMESILNCTMIKSMIDIWSEGTRKSPLFDLFLFQLESKLGYSVYKFFDLMMVMENIDPAIMFETCLSFDTYETLIPNENESFPRSGDFTIYSSRFYIHLFAHTLTVGKIPLKKLLESNLLALAIRCLSSNDHHYRYCAYNILDIVMTRFSNPFEYFDEHTDLEFCADFKVRKEYYYVLHVFRSGITREQGEYPQISSFIAVFLVHVLKIIMDPLDPLFIPINRFFLSRPVFDMSDIPLLYECLYPTSKVMDPLKARAIKDKEAIGTRPFKKFIVSILKRTGSDIDVRLLHKRRALELVLTVPDIEPNEVLHIYSAYLKHQCRNGKSSGKVLAQLLVYLSSRYHVPVSLAEQHLRNKEFLTDLNRMESFLEQLSKIISEK